MRSLVVYYSLDGNTRLIAGAMAAAVGGDTQELRPLRDISPKGFMRYLWGGKQVISQRKPELHPLVRNPSDYDLVFVGTPVWAGTYAPALRTFLDSGTVRDKAVALFCCFGGSTGRSFRQLRTSLAGNRILGEIGFRDPARRNTDEAVARAAAWAREMIKLAGG
jgi:flavodoxin